MRFLKRFIGNILFLVAILVLIYLIAPEMMKQVYSLLGALFGPLLVVIVVVVALPGKERTRKQLSIDAEAASQSSRHGNNGSSPTMVNGRETNPAMEIKRSRAGESTHKLADSRYKDMIIIAVIGVLLFLVISALINNSKALGIGGSGILILLILIKIFPDLLDGFLSKKEKEVKRARRGAKAEETVDQILAELSDEDHSLLNDVACPYGNIDHILISKTGGVFLIETKSHYGKVSIQDNAIYINGEMPEKDFISQTLKNTYWLRDQIKSVTGLSVWIHPVIVFTNAFVPFVAPTKGIIVINKRFLLSTIEKESKPTPINEKLWGKKEVLFANLE